MEDLLFEIMLRANSIEQVSAVKIETSFGRHFLAVLFLYTDSHPVLLPSLEQSGSNWSTFRGC